MKVATIVRTSRVIVSILVYRREILTMHTYCVLLSWLWAVTRWWLSCATGRRCSRPQPVGWRTIQRTASRTQRTSSNTAARFSSLYIQYLFMRPSYRPHYASCPSVGPSVCYVRTHNSQTTKHRETKIGVNVSRNGSNWCTNFQFKRAKGRGHRTSERRNGGDQ